VYFNQDPVFNAGGGALADSEAAPAAAQASARTSHQCRALQLSPLDPSETPKTPERPQADEAADMRQLARQFGFVEPVRPRVVMQFPAKENDMLLSGTISGGQALANRPLVLDVRAERSHRDVCAAPFWRWQTQGTYFLAFNAILNWNHLDAGKPERERNQPTPTAQDQQ